MLFPRLGSGWINLAGPRKTRVFTEEIRKWLGRKDSMSVTNHLKCLLGVFLISQPPVHIPKEKKNRNL